MEYYWDSIGQMVACFGLFKCMGQKKIQIEIQLLAAHNTMNLFHALSKQYHL